MFTLNSFADRTFLNVYDACVSSWCFYRYFKRCQIALIALIFRSTAKSHQLQSFMNGAVIPIFTALFSRHLHSFSVSANLRCGKLCDWLRPEFDSG